MTARKFKIGEAVIWTSYHDGTRHEATITGYDGTPAPNGGHCYAVALGDEHHDSIVAEVDLSPWPRPKLGVAHEPAPEQAVPQPGAGPNPEVEPRTNWDAPWSPEDES